MPTHWTYAQFGVDDDLDQGDILAPTDELRGIFKEVHPHFGDPKYTAFLVTTQSCDLVRRKGRCATRYLNIAVVRELEAVLHDLLSHTCRAIAEGIYLQESKGEARKLIERLFGQNEQSLGLFYLHPEPESGIATPSVALLRISVTLRVDHYEALKRARTGRLNPEFRSKLGWLVGNLFSRVGTQDWTHPPDRQTQLQTLIADVLDGNAAKTPLWVHESWVNAAKTNGVDLASLPRDQVITVLEGHKPPPPKDILIGEVARVVKEVFANASDEELVRLKSRLNNDPRFNKAIKKANS